MTVPLIPLLPFYTTAPAAEALLSGAQHAPQALASDRLLLLAAALVPPCVTFSGALNRDTPGFSDRQGAMSTLDLSRRLRALMLGAARLVTAVAPAPRPRPSLSASAGASAPAVAAVAAVAAVPAAAAGGARPASRNGDVSAHSGAVSGTGSVNRSPRGRAVATAAAAAVAAPSAFAPELDMQRPWAWDVTRPLVGFMPSDAMGGVTAAGVGTSDITAIQSAALIHPVLMLR